MTDFINIGVKEDSPEKLAYIADNNIPAKHYVSAEDIMKIVWAVNQLNETAFTGDFEDLNNVNLFSDWSPGHYKAGKTVFHNLGIFLNTQNNNTSEPSIESTSWKLLAQINEGVLGFNWENIGGNQMSVNISGFTNDGNGIYPFATLDDLNRLVEQLAGGRSDNNYSDEDKSKLDNLVGTRFVGTFPTLEDLLEIYPDGLPGGYADVGIPGEGVVRYEWSQSTFEWVVIQNQSGEFDFSPSDYDLSEFQNEGESPFVRADELPTDISDLTDSNDLLFSGDYNDLQNKPTLPEAFNPENYDLSEFQNGGEDPFVKHSELPTQDGFELIRIACSPNGEDLDALMLRVPIHCFVVSEEVCKLISVTATVSEAPEGSNIEVDVLHNSSLIKEIAIEDGTNIGLEVFEETTITMGDVINIEISSIGNSVPGKDLQLIFKLQKV